MAIKVGSRKIVQLNDTADDWDLYTATMQCEPIAEALNLTFLEAVNDGLNRDQVEEKVCKVMKQYASYGATDSEPIRHLQFLLHKVFG